MSDLVRALLTTPLFVAPLALSAWAFLDIARRPSWAWALSTRSQVSWMLAVGLGALTLVGGVAVSGWYLMRVRPEVEAAESGVVGGP